ncbi:MAG: PEP-CTERM sorting domain-containing protein [Verrucomicrobiota bacterium]
MKTHSMIHVVGALLLLAVAVQADWNPGDPFKMHYPQLPDPFGWDVAFTSVDPMFGNTLADDFKCAESGEITGVHFWVSWNYDDVMWETVRNIHLSIHSDAPAGVMAPWSQPDQLLWEGDSEWDDFQWNERFYENGDQGWYDPVTGIDEPLSHHETWQINITDILNPFRQEEGNIYWLDIRIDQDPIANGRIGWKTSRDHWNDDGVYDLIPEDPLFNEWMELRDPITEESLDLAFVIVPEPSVIAMILATSGGFLFLRRKFMV